MEAVGHTGGQVPGPLDQDAQGEIKHAACLPVRPAQLSEAIFAKGRQCPAPGPKNRLQGKPARLAAGRLQLGVGMVNGPARVTPIAGHRPRPQRLARKGSPITQSPGTVSSRPGEK